MQNWLRKKLAFIKHTPFHPQWLINKPAFFNEKIKHLNECTVLDVGCADRWVEAVLPENCRYLGIDYPATGSELYAANPDVFADASCLPIQSDKIDVVTLFEIIEHLESPQEALQEAYRVLKPGGSLWLTVPFIYPIHDAPFDFQRLTTFGLMRDLTAAGFVDINITSKLNAVQTSCLLLNIALSGAMLVAAKEKRLSIVLLPLVILLIVLLNLAARLSGRVLSNWPGLTNGYSVIAVKRQRDLLSKA
jgi:SAM-dependent methyltransferase